MEDDAQAVLTVLRDDGRAMPTHVLRNRLGWEIGRFMPAVTELATQGDVVRVGEMLSLPVANFVAPTLPPDVAREDAGDDQESVLGPDIPLTPGDPDPPASGERRFLVATAWEEHDGTAQEIAEALLREDDRKVLLVAEEDAVIFERAVVARRVP